jgi:outer membrane cobalamin receptor
LKLSLILSTALAIAPTLVTGQTDTSRASRLDAVVITASRVPGTIATSTAAVSRIGAAALKRLPVRTLADALRFIPGMAFVNFDGMGYDPQLMLRGFYGGGEAEYVQLLLDGRPINALESGRATWDQIPISTIESIEVVRGGASAAWGDAALGGVINVRTYSGGPRLGGLVEVGSFGELQASATAGSSWNGRPLSLFGGLTNSDGYREHAERSTGNVGATVALVSATSRNFSLSTSHDWRGIDDPGYVASTVPENERHMSSAFFRFDHNSERTHRVGLDYETAVAGDARLVARVGYEARYGDRIRTLLLAPVFADTREREFDAGRTQLSAQLQLDRLLLGVDASIGSIDNNYYTFMLGGESDYESTAASRGELDAKGNGRRSAAAGFALYSFEFGTALSFSAGARFDWLDDLFEGEAPSDAVEISATHVAFSPKLGASWRYSEGGHAYASFGRSFKAPTLDQLFDQRGIPVEFPPFSITFANPALNPQYGTSYEAGLYQSAAIGSGGAALDLTLSLYQTDLRDEVDFDVATFSYGNIGRSRHRGVELGASLITPATLRFFGNYTMQAPVSRSGDNEGKYLKAIPRHFVTAGAGYGAGEGLSLLATVTSAMKMYLDDANTERLEDWSRVDVRAAWALPSGRGRVFVDVLNALDANYASSGFPDAAGTGVVYLYPAAGRSFRFGLSANR